VEVVGHEAVGQQANIVAGEGLGQDAFEGVVVGVVVEDGEPCDGAVPDPFSASWKTRARALPRLVTW